MFLLNSYRSLSKWFVLAALIVGCSTASAQEPEVDTTPPSSKYSREDVYLQDMEEDEDEGTGAITRQPAGPALRKVPDSTVKQFKADPDFAYANDPEYWTEPEQKRKSKPRRQREERDPSMFDFSGIFGIVKFVFLALLVALFGFLIYKLMGNRWPWQQPVKLNEAGELLAEEELDADELQQKIRESIDQKNFRLAIRYSYLFTLRRMDEKGWIRLDTKSTNLDYVNQMKAYDPQGIFSYLTNIYDYVWYGEFELNEEQFQLVYKDFQNFLNTHSH